IPLLIFSLYLHDALPIFTRSVIYKNNPTLSNKDVEFAVIAVNIFATGIHTLFIGLSIWLSTMVLKRRKWARIVLTFLLVIATGGSFISWEVGPAFYGTILATNILHIVLIGLLWVPKPVARYFSA